MHGLKPPGVAPGHEPTPGSTMPVTREELAPSALEHDWNLVCKMALKHLDRFMSYEPKVLRGDDPDAIHDMRVASRRLQQVLDLIYPTPRPKEIRQIRRQVRRCRQALGGVRNCDVLLDRANKVLARKRVGHREAWIAVHDYLEECRSRSFAKALRKLSKTNLTVFYVHLKGRLEHFGPSLSPGHHSHNDAQATVIPLEPLSQRLGQALEGIWKAFEDQVALSLENPQPLVIHGVRIAAKKLRYLLEVVHQFDVVGSAESLGWLRKLQRHLGEWHDLEVLEQMMIQMVARPDFLRKQLPLAMEVEKLILRNRAGKKGFESKYFRITRDAPEVKRVRDWVDYLVASPSTAFAKG
jgi:CHAD domain-containing protein